MFLDGIYVAGGPQSINTVDLQRIEVLKGPQNTYFGRGTFGGAVNYITRNPSEKFGGEVNMRITARGSSDVDASVEGPLMPGKLSGRVTTYSHNKVAQYHANDGGALGAENSKGLSGTLYATPTDDLWLRGRVNYQQDDDSMGEIALLSGNTYAAGACAGKFFAGFNERTGQPIAIQSPPRNYFCNGLPKTSDIGTSFITATTHLPIGFASVLRNNNVFLTAPNATNPTPASAPVPFFDQVPSLDHAGMRRDALRLSFQSGYTFVSGASLGLSVGYNRQNSISIFDIDRSDRAEEAAGTSFMDAQAFHSEDLTVDARFLSNPAEPLRFLLGVSQYTQKYQTAQISHTYPKGVATAIQPLYPNGFDYRSGNYQDVRANVPAVYGSVDYDLLKTVTLTVEGRYQNDKPKNVTATGVELTQSFKKFLPRGTIKFHPYEDFQVYGSYAVGVQPAGFTTAFANLTPAQQAYVQTIYPGVSVYSLQPEIKALELGAKGRLLDGAATYSIAMYQNDWTNAVTTAAVFNPTACLTASPPISNTAACPLASNGTAVQTPNNARIRGIELDVTANVSAALALDMTLDYKDAKWVKYRSSAFNSFLFPTGAQPGDAYRGDGNHMARVPDLMGTFGATYRGDLFANWRYYARGEVLYTGRAWDSDLNLYRTNAYARVNANLGFIKDNLTLELFAKNLLNDQNYDYAGITVELQGSFADRAALVLPAQKREFGLRASYKF